MIHARIRFQLHHYIALASADLRTVAFSTTRMWLRLYLD